jgi:S-adenosyl-L-methionine hydrolase (adenosine-forming)
VILHRARTLSLSLLTLASLGLTLQGCPPPPPPPPPVVVLLTDFGLRDDAVGLMRGVILDVCPRATIADLSHQVSTFDVTDGARLLAEAPSVYPAGTVFVVVVDPGVGTARRAIVARLPNGSLIVAPDNGVITLAAQRHGSVVVREVTNRALERSEMSSTFHGRDLFAPVGGHLARGVPFADVGPVVEDWIRLELPQATRADEQLRGQVIGIDEPFGNVWTNVPGEWLEQLGAGQGSQVRVRVGELEFALPHVATFGDVPEGQPLLYVNSRGQVSLALNMADFARTHSVEPGQPVVFEAGP